MQRAYSFQVGVSTSPGFNRRFPQLAYRLQVGKKELSLLSENGGQEALSRQFASSLLSGSAVKHLFPYSVPHCVLIRNVLSRLPTS